VTTVRNLKIELCNETSWKDFKMFKKIVAVSLIAFLALTSGASASRVASISQQSAEIEVGYMLTQTQGSDRRGDRRDDRQDDRGDRKDDRQDCKDAEGVAGKDKRDCKQDGRQDRNSDG
jgi:hypothetical protein